MTSYKEQAKDTTGPSSGGLQKRITRCTYLRHCGRGTLLGLQQTALFGKCLLAHELSKFRERLQRMHQPFDGNLLEHLGPAPDDKDLLVCISAEINVLPNQIQMNRVTSFSNTHRSILTNFANKMVAMHLGQLSVRVNELRKWRQTGKFWECDTRWLVPTGKPLVGPLCVVVKHEASVICRACSSVCGQWTCMHS